MQSQQKLFVRQFGEFHTCLVRPTFSASEFASRRAITRSETANAGLYANTRRGAGERARAAHFRQAAWPPRDGPVGSSIEFAWPRSISSMPCALPTNAGSLAANST